MPEPSLNYNIDQLQTRVRGQGQPEVLLLHGWGGNLDSLTALADPLSCQRRVWALSLPGFGDSPPPPTGWGTGEYVQLVRLWLEAKGLSQVDIIAHSFGGRIALSLASHHPDMVKRLVLIAAAGLRPQRSLKTRAKLMISKSLNRIGRVAGGSVKAWLDQRKERLGSADWRAASPRMRMVLSRVIGEDLTPDLGLVKASTLLIYGDKDTATPVSMGNRMAALIPESKLVVLKGAGHYCFLDQKGDVLAAIWRHLELPPAW
ncbi:MAG: alpha/beta hydrolase [Calditrichota bacterium]